MCLYTRIHTSTYWFDIRYNIIKIIVKDAWILRSIDQGVVWNVRGRNVRGIIAKGEMEGNNCEGGEMSGEEMGREEKWDNQNDK